MSVCSELMLRGFAANQLNNEILALKWGPFAFFISGSMNNERMMRNANLKIRIVFKKMCFHVAATRRCAIHLTNTYNILQLFSCFSFVAWISLLQGELSLHEDWAQSSRGLVLKPWSTAATTNPYEVSKMFMFKNIRVLESFRQLEEIQSMCIDIRNMYST